MNIRGIALVMKGLFHKVRNRTTRQRFVISTIRKDENLFETAVFEANFFYLPCNLKHPALIIETRSKDDAWEAHHSLATRLKQEYPERLFQEFS